jgi:hypothetical protein
MLCGACQTEVEATKFCSNCGAPLAKHETKSRAEVSIEWIREIFSSLGYEAGDITKGENGSTFFAKHAQNPNVSLDYRPALRVVIVTTMWTVKAPSLIERGEFFKALNSMNLETIACQCSVPEKDMTTLFVQFTFFVTDVISRLDVIAFNELATSLVRRVINQPRVQKIMT